MKKFALLFIGGIVAFILLANLWLFIGLVITLAILYFLIKQFLTTESLSWKIVLAILGLFILFRVVVNAPMILVIVAAYVVYMVVKKWHEQKLSHFVEIDSFQSIEK